MANQQLVEYIKKVQLQGFPEVTVREVLVKNGWQPNDINDAFLEIKRVEDLLQKDAPMAPSFVPVSVGQTVKVVSQEKSILEKAVIEHNSPFSVGLAAVLFIALLILVNKIIDDSAISTVDANARLIFDAMIILPFLTVAFILNGSFSEDNKRYQIISQPYFVTSAWLLVRLLWDTSAYILNTNATYGVYVVLILVIAVLTGIVIFVQKYIKN
jgi:hypothetical protein